MRVMNSRDAIAGEVTCSWTRFSPQLKPVPLQAEACPWPGCPAPSLGPNSWDCNREKKSPHKPYLSSWLTCVLLHMIPQAFHQIFSQRRQPILSGHCQQCTLLWLRGPHRTAEGGKSFLFFSEGPGAGAPERQGTSIMRVTFT